MQRMRSLPCGILAIALLKKGTSRNPLKLRSREAPFKSESTQDSESKLYRQLRLTWITHTLPQKAVKVEQTRCAKRVDIVLVVESIKQLKDRNQRVAFTKLERTLNAPVKGKVLVVFQQSIAVRCCPHLWSYRLCRSGLYAKAGLESLADFGIGIKIELVPDVAVRQRIVEAKVEDIERTIRERIPLV